MSIASSFQQFDEQKVKNFDIFDLFIQYQLMKIKSKGAKSV